MSFYRIFRDPWGSKQGCAQDAHTRAWAAVSDYMTNNLQFFHGRALEAESTTLPALTGWLQESLNEIPDFCLT